MITDFQAISDSYQAAFGNITDIAHPSILHEDRFYSMLQDAVKARQALMPADMERTFGELGWEE